MRCRICESEKSDDEFYLRSTGTRRAECKVCFIERQRIKNLGVCNTQYAAMLEEQDGRCAICRNDLDHARNKKFAVDHDHRTGAIRGLLCTNCNTAIGLMDDDTDRIEAAIDYLNTHRQKALGSDVKSVTQSTRGMWSSLPH